MCVYTYIYIYMLTPRYADRFHDFPTKAIIRARRGLGGKEVLHADQAYCPKHQNSKKSNRSLKKSSYTGDLFGALKFVDRSLFL